MSATTPTKEELTRIVIRDAHTELVKANGWLTTRIYVADLKMLLDKIAELCPTHGWCEHCVAPVCEACGLGQFADCDCPCLHCRSDECMDRCARDNHADEDAHTPASWSPARFG